MEIKKVCENQKCKNYIEFSTKDKIKYNIITTFTILLTITILSLNNLAIAQVYNAMEVRNQTVESTWREQGRNVLQDLKSQFLADEGNKIVYPYSEISIDNWSKNRLSGITVGGPTGTIFLIDLSDSRFAWCDFPGLDNLDKNNESTYLLDSYKYFYDKESALNTFSKMRQIYSTNAASKITWNLDGSKSLLEWVIIPSDSLGFNGEAPILDGIKNPEYKAYLLGVSIQEDEILTPYEPINIIDKSIINLLTKATALSS